MLSDIGKACGLGSPRHPAGQIRLAKRGLPFVQPRVFRAAKIISPKSPNYGAGRRVDVHVSFISLNAD